MDFYCLSSSFEVEEDDSRPTVQILAPEGVVVAVARIEKAREGEVQMLEGLGYQVAGKDNGKVGQH